MPESLWGELPTGEGIITPHSILMEQAEILTRQTQGLLVGRVKRGETVFGRLRSTLQIAVPSIKYTYDVLVLEYGVELYPVTVETPSPLPDANASNERELRSVLKAVLTSEPVQRAVAGLMAQVRAEAGAEKLK